MLWSLGTRSSTFGIPTTSEFISRCHLGKVARYDTVTRFGWSVDLRNHPIKVAIESVLNEDWEPSEGREVPLIEEEKDCVVGIGVSPFRSVTKIVLT